MSFVAPLQAARGPTAKRAKTLQRQLAAEMTEDECDELLRKILTKFSQGLDQNPLDLVRFIDNCVTDKNRIKWLTMILDAFDGKGTKVVGQLKSVLEAIVPNIDVTATMSRGKVLIAIRNAANEGDMNAKIYASLKRAPLQLLPQDSQVGTPSSSATGGGTPLTTSTVFDVSSPQQQQQQKKHQQNQKQQQQA